MRGYCLSAIAAAFLTALLAGCSSTGISATAYNPGYGPFDRHGDYVEAWADKPAKKHRWSRKPAQTGPARPAPAPAAKKEPVLLAGTTPRGSSQRGSPSASGGSPLASLGRTSPVSRPPEPKPASRPRPPASRPRPPASRPPAATPRPTPPAVASTPPPRPKPAAKPKPKPKPVKVTPRKPAPIRHTVRKGDTLYSLSRRYSTSVGAIQRANGLRGSTIRIGQSLRIPR